MTVQSIAKNPANANICIAKTAASRPLSSSRRSFARREPFEFYPTPPEATRALLSVERFEGTIWEPACGDGAISKVLEAAGYYVISTDLIDRGYGTGGVDFLKTTEALGRNIVTNPPYGTHGL
jgi:tRNA G10  N-methylase Trm11